MSSLTFCCICSAYSSLLPVWLSASERKQGIENEDMALKVSELSKLM